MKKIRLAAALLCSLGSIAGAQPQDTPCDRTLQFADRLYQRGDQWDIAIDQYRKFLSDCTEDPRVPGAKYRLGDSYYQLGDLTAARATFEELLDETKTADRNARTQLRLGEIACRSESYDEAISRLLSLLKQNPGPEIAEASRYFLAESYRRTGSASKAIEVFEQNLRDFPGGPYSPYSAVSISKVLVSEGRGEEAARRLVEMAAQDGKSSDPAVLSMVQDAILTAAQIYRDEHKPGKAAATYHRFSTEFPDSPRVPDALYGEASAWYGMGAYPDAEPALSQLVARLEEGTRLDLRIQAHYLYGMVLYETGEHEKAFLWFEKTLDQTQPADRAADLHPLAAAQAVQCLYHLGRYEEVLQQSDQFISRFTDQREVQGRMLYLKGQSLVRLDRNGEAILEFAYLLDKYPGHELVPQATYQIGRCSLLEGQNEAAARNLLTYVDRYPDTTEAPEALYFAAEAYYRLSQFAKAGEQFSRLEEQYTGSPRREVALLRMGECSYQLRDHDRVFQTFDRFLREFPRSDRADVALYYRAFIYQTRHQYKRAIADYGEILDGFPKSRLAGDARLRKGLTEFHAGYSDAAAETFLPLILGPEPPRGVDTSVYLWLAGYLQDGKRYKEALAVYEKAEEVFPSEDVIQKSLYERGECFRLLRKCPDAVILFQKLLLDYKGSPYAPPTNYGLGLCLAQAGNLPEAERAFLAAQETEDATLAAHATFHYAEVLRDRDAVEEAYKSYLLVAYRYDHPTLTARSYLQAALCQETLGNKERACQIYQDILETCQDSPEAATAETRLGSDLCAPPPTPPADR